MYDQFLYMFQRHWRMMCILYGKPIWYYWSYSLYYLNPNSLFAYCLFKDWKLQIKLTVVFVYSYVSYSSSMAYFDAKLLKNIHSANVAKEQTGNTCSLGLILCLLRGLLPPLTHRQAWLTAGWGGSHGLIPTVGPADSQPTPVADHGSRTQMNSEPSWDH